MRCLMLKGRALSAASNITGTCLAAVLVGSMLLSTSARAQPPAGRAGDVSDQEAVRMFAASPQRELRREWEQCAGTVIYLAVAQGKSAEETRSLVTLGCADQESRLTGAMVREYGYDLGNGAMERLRASAREVIERRISARDNPSASQSASPGQVMLERLPGGWEVFRTQGVCSAAAVEHSIYGDNFVALLRETGGDRIVFGQISSLATREATRFGGSGARLRTSVSALANNTGGGIGDLDFEIIAFGDGVGFKTELTPRLIGILSQAEAIQFSPQTPGSMIGTPRTFNVQGSAAAWAAVLRCAEGSARR